MPKGGPDGGDGGDGGGVWLVVDRNVASLLAFKDHPHRARAAAPTARASASTGGAAPTLEVPVPEGTTVRDQDGTVLADLVGAGDRWLAAEGGRGGRGNARFLSNRRRAPAFAEQGEVGEERWLRLELKLLADVALVGFPSVGKSTLISTISAAKPKIADYPFTTLEPNLGVVRLGDDAEFVVADLPGLIEGASEGQGLGHQFLRHVERARVLLLLLDLSPLAEHPPAEQERILLDELGRYEPELLDRPRLVVGSPRRPGRAGRGLRRAPHRGGHRRRGARAGRALAEAVQRARAELPEAEAFVVHRPVAEGYRIERGDDGAWTVAGRQAERAVALSDLTNAEALDEAHRRLRALGRRQGAGPGGARDGDTVHIGRLAFDYEDVVVIVVTKIGTSSITDDDGEIDESAVAKFCAEAAGAPRPGPPRGARDVGRHRRRAAGAGLHGR